MAGQPYAADSDLFGRFVLALVPPYRNDHITHVAAVESRGFVLGGAAATALGTGEHPRHDNNPRPSMWRDAGGTYAG
jgi:hypothetical protein